MKLNSLSSEVSVSANVGGSSRFSMDANAKAFRVLSDTLYQNKIGSMVREVCCNAYDSHVEAGYADRPFSVHLPDAFEPHFSVRDYGIGLDDNGVREVFTTYFRSTKDSNNDMVGAFGLGSKTPFAYTDSFTIVAIKDGIKRQYSAYIDADGLPTVTMLGEVEVTDDNGVEIIVPVINNGDFNKFRHEVSRQLTFFTTKPVIDNAGAIEVEWMDWQGADQYFNSNNVLVGGQNSGLRGAWIVQGIVGYPLNIGDIEQHLSEQNRNFLNAIRGACILKFDLGQIEVTPSREGISYSKFTLDNIGLLLDNARVNIEKDLQAQIDAVDGPFAKALFINESEGVANLVPLTKCGFEAEGFYKASHKYFMDFDRIVNFDGIALDTDVKYESDYYDVEVNKVGDAKLREEVNIHFIAYKTEYKRGRNRWKESGRASAVKVSDSVRILVKDTKDKPVVRTRAYLEDLPRNLKVFVMENADGSLITADQIAAVQANVGAGCTFDMLSDVVPPTPEARGRNGYKPPTAYTYNKGDDRDTAREWERETEKLEEFEDGAYYLIVDRHSLMLPPDYNALFAMNDAGLLDRPIMAIREKDVKRIEDNAKWLPFAGKNEEIVKAIVSNKSIINGFALEAINSVGLSKLDTDMVELLRTAYKDGKLVNAGKLDEYFRVETAINKIKDRASRRGNNGVARVVFQTNYGYVNKRIEELRKCIEGRVNEIFEGIIGQYPLLPYMDSRNYRNGYRPMSNVEDALIDYVNANAGA